ncbi:hypothetical protein WA026_016064 [Henosepilachna vigintioctopunctata]|uniref:Uncharacterized protein n=1 Tax=Henosepilachna vigintioctopunctata TaxID=420089 RepID=A0AAW1U9W3_9CUCU
MNKLFAITFFLIWLISLSQGFSCRPNICQLVRCAPASPKTCIGPNRVLMDGPCGCCKICFIYLDEGESCPKEGLLASEMSGCRRGLKCIDGVCRQKLC